VLRGCGIGGLLLLAEAEAGAVPNGTLSRARTQLQDDQAAESGIAAFLLPNPILLPNPKTDHRPCLPHMIVKKLLVRSEIKFQIA
jgi:hypothetical protein